jgi:beta-glucosidase/6-phospho-beta-glucosidase/beta-galactosidase
MDEKYNFITIGSDCSSANALRELGLRKFALPFDWVQSFPNSFKNCIKTNFAHYHTNLFYNRKKSRLIDSYGFQFPHDYPVKKMENMTTNVDDYIIEGNENNTIVENWKHYYDNVKEKYNRRIERWNTILHNKEKPIIILSRYPANIAKDLLEFLMNYYSRNDLFMVNCCTQVNINDFHKNIVYINADIDDKIWNNVKIWRNGLEKLYKIL